MTRSVLEFVSLAIASTVALSCSLQPGQDGPSSDQADTGYIGDQAIEVDGEIVSEIFIPVEAEEWWIEELAEALERGESSENEVVHHWTWPTL
jgi:hypothetical protein